MEKQKYRHRQNVLKKKPVKKKGIVIDISLISKNECRVRKIKNKVLLCAGIGNRGGALKR